MDTKIQFSFSRMLQVLKHEILGNLRYGMYAFCTIYGGMLIVLLLVLWFSNCLSISDVAVKFRLFAAIFFTWGASYFATEIMKPMHNKAVRLSFLMLPATNLEKFVSRFLYVSLGFVVVFCAAMMAVDLTYQILTPVLRLGDDFYGSLSAKMVTIPYYGKFGFNERYSDLLINGTVCSIVGSLFGHSLWILGGSLWYRHAFVKTLVAQIIAVLAWIFAISAYAEFFSWSIDAYFLFNLMIVVLAVLTLVIYYLSYRLFVRSQVVSRSKFFLK